MARFFELTCNLKVAYHSFMIDVFFALGDDTRRLLLDRLRVGGQQSLTELAGGFPMSRQAVTKHLDVLESAGLVQRFARGRERVHRLNGDPLKRVDDWLAPFEAEWDERLGRLTRHLERKEANDG